MNDKERVVALWSQLRARKVRSYPNVVTVLDKPLEQYTVGFDFSAPGRRELYKDLSETKGRGYPVFDGVPKRPYEKPAIIKEERIPPKVYAFTPSDAAHCSTQLAKARMIDFLKPVSLEEMKASVNELQAKIQEVESQAERKIGSPRYLQDWLVRPMGGKE